MRTPLFSTVSFAALASLSLLPTLRATPVTTLTIASRQIPKTVVIDGHTLPLNGAGVRDYSLLFISIGIYVGALYLPYRTHQARVALTEHGPDRIAMYFIHGVDHGDLLSAWRSGFRKNVPLAMRRVLASEIHRFLAIWTRIHDHDVVFLDYLPRQGTRVTLNGKLLGTFPGRDFHEALLRIWLGPHPPTHKLKRALLGRS